MAFTPEEIKRANTALNVALREAYKQCAKKVPSLKGVSWEKFCHHMPVAAFSTGFGTGIGAITGTQNGVVTREDTVQLAYMEVPLSNKESFAFTQSALGVLATIGDRLTHTGFGTVIPSAIVYGHLKLSGKEALNKIAELAV